ncbi:hypothetical protein AVEN_237759-1 [Araneus ventricosus]|uniref:Uncharacterized protein n=1 Tax=Araneus ventricosus TaxID=182803 RepID=A0A4Y2MQ61_ARAVE|nr:hypothetical protein AVEN_237759-1 [Araneus ventricosus]
MDKIIKIQMDKDHQSPDEPRSSDPRWTKRQSNGPRWAKIMIQDGQRSSDPRWTKIIRSKMDKDHQIQDGQKISIKMDKIIDQDGQRSSDPRWKRSSDPR